MKETEQVDQLLLGSYQAYEGVLADRLSLEIDDPIMSLDLVGEMYKLQELSIDFSELSEADFESMIRLSSLQKVEIRNYKGNIPSLRQSNKLAHICLDSCVLEDLSFLNDMESLVVLEISNSEVENFYIPDNLISVSCFNRGVTKLYD